MYCTTSCEHTSASVFNFFDGTNNSKVESVKKHEASLAHKSAQLKQNTADRPTETPAAKSLVSLNKIVINSLKHLFRNAHALAKKGRSYADYEWMCNLDEAKGVDIGKTYRNRKVAAVFVEFIAEVERHNLREKVLKSNFLSIISDGTTDSSIQETKIVSLF